MWNKFEYWKQVLGPFEANPSSRYFWTLSLLQNFWKTVFSWEVLYGNGSECIAQQNNPTPECMVNDTECYDSWLWALYLFCLYLILSAWLVKICLSFDDLLWVQLWCYKLKLSSDIHKFTVKNILINTWFQEMPGSSGGRDVWYQEMPIYSTWR